MKLQGLGIIFALIALPIILVLSYYIQLQVETIAIQTAYDTKLLDATHDAIAAFELNTSNEDLSSVADSLRTIIAASNNIFINTLSTNLGMSNASKSYVQPYIPAILYVLYDGYYIYAPTKVPTVCTTSTGLAVYVGDTGVTKVGSKYKYDKESEAPYSGTFEDYSQLLYKVKGEDLYTVNLDADVEYTIDYVLKSYIPYSAKYENDSKTKEITINYTLDNYLTILGSIDGVYYTKSGYLMDTSLINDIKLDGVSGKLEEYNEVDAEEICLSNEKVEVMLADGTTIINNSDDNKSAVAYYVKSYIFSKWIYNNLSDIKEKNIKEDISLEIKDLYKAKSGSDNIIYEFSEREGNIFNNTVGYNPEKEKSTFYNHKREVIKNSIKYNLNLAMSSYNTMSSDLISFNMPVISDKEWDQIIDNISIVTFMQGFKCGLKTYNNYAIVSSTNNELIVIPEEIYYVKNGAVNDWESIYHRIDCPKLLENSEEENADTMISSFKSKEVKYDRIYDSVNKEHKYDHKNIACYNCIVASSYEREIKSAGYDGYGIGIYEEGLSTARKKAYDIAIGKEKYNLYKMNAIKESQGYEILFSGDKGVVGGDSTTGVSSTRGINEVKGIQIILSNTNCYNKTIAIVKFDVKINGHNIGNYSISLNQKTEQTINIKVHEDDVSKINNVIFNKTYPSDDVDYTIKSIKVIYE